MVCALAHASPPLKDSYDTMVRRAREGDTAPALAFLRAQPLTEADGARRVADWIDIAGWAGLDGEVVQVYRQHGLQRALPVSTLGTVARAHRNLREWDDALAVYARALAHRPLLHDERAVTSGRDDPDAARDLPL